MKFSDYEYQVIKDALVADRGHRALDDDVRDHISAILKRIDKSRMARHHQARLLGHRNYLEREKEKRT
jgi:hypothetical protein